MNNDDVNLHSTIDCDAGLAADFKHKPLILKPKLSDHISEVPQRVFDLNEF